MYRLPSVKTLEKQWPTKGNLIRELLERHPAQWRMTLDLVCPVIGGFGVETIYGNGAKRNPNIHYVNMGDPYVNTIMCINGNYVVGNWGSIVERGNYA
jgi:hypothetical protein